QGLKTDRELIRTLARRLAEVGPASVSMRATVSQLIAAGGSPKGRILMALRRSPLADADLQISRERLAGRAQRSHDAANKPEPPTEKRVSVARLLPGG